MVLTQPLASKAAQPLGLTARLGAVLETAGDTPSPTRRAASTQSRRCSAPSDRFYSFSSSVSFITHGPDAVKTVLGPVCADSRGVRNIGRKEGSARKEGPHKEGSTHKDLCSKAVNPGFGRALQAQSPPVEHSQSPGHGSRLGPVPSLQHHGPHRLARAGAIRRDRTRDLGGGL